MADLGTFGGSYSAAYGISSSGQVVGASETADGAVHAFLYSDNQMVDLNTLLILEPDWVFQRAFVINDVGQMLVDAWSSEYDGTNIFLLTPQSSFSVPTPSTQSLLLLGASLLGWFRLWQQGDNLFKIKPIS